MQDRETIIKQLIKSGYSDKTAEILASGWESIVEKFPIGANVVDSDDPTDVRQTLDGGFYDNAEDPYINVTEGGLWTVRTLRKA
jgi:hypothetical protein